MVRKGVGVTFAAQVPLEDTSWLGGTIRRQEPRSWSCAWAAGTPQSTSFAPTTSTIWEMLREPAATR